MARLVQLVNQLLEKRARPLNNRTTKILTGFAALGVTLATLWAWRASEITNVVWQPISILACVAAPLTLLLKSAEYQLCAHLASQKPTQNHSLRVAILSSSANLLPLPGSLLVTVRSLAQSGSTYGKAIKSSAIPGLAWLALCGLIGGTAIAIEGPALLGLATIVCGALVGGFTIKLFGSAKFVKPRLTLAFAIVVVELAWLAISALRLGLAVKALGVDISPQQALALSVAGALTVAIGVFPAGLGLREALLAGLSPLINLSFDVGVLLGSLDRLIWISFLGLANLVLVAAMGLHAMVFANRDAQ